MVSTLSFPAQKTPRGVSPPMFVGSSVSPPCPEPQMDHRLPVLLSAPPMCVPQKYDGGPPTGFVHAGFPLNRPLKTYTLKTCRHDPNGGPPFGIGISRDAERRPTGSWLLQTTPPQKSRTLCGSNRESRFLSHPKSSSVQRSVTK